jgi:hypothetical protein
MANIVVRNIDNKTIMYLNYTRFCHSRRMKCGLESIVLVLRWILSYPSGVGNDKNQKFVISLPNDFSIYVYLILNMNNFVYN